MCERRRDGALPTQTRRRLGKNSPTLPFLLTFYFIFYLSFASRISYAHKRSVSSSLTHTHLCAHIIHTHLTHLCTHVDTHTLTHVDTLTLTHAYTRARSPLMIRVHTKTMAIGTTACSRTQGRATSALRWATSATPTASEDSHKEIWIGFEEGEIGEEEERGEGEEIGEKDEGGGQREVDVCGKWGRKQGVKGCIYIACVVRSQLRALRPTFVSSETNDCECTFERFLVINKPNHCNHESPPLPPLLHLRFPSSLPF